MTKFFTGIFMLLSFTVTKGQTFVKGFIVTYNNDTVTCSILKLKNKKQEEVTSYKEFRIKDSVAVERTLYPKDVIAYSKDGTFYKSADFYGEHIFMKLLVRGKATLYYYSTGPGGEKYIFKKDTEKELNVMDFETRFDKVVGGPTQSSRSAAALVMDRPRPFISYFTHYFNDCLNVKAKIGNEFYTKDDMVDIFKDYNKFCGNP